MDGYEQIDLEKERNNFATLCIKMQYIINESLKNLNF